MVGKMPGAVHPVGTVTALAYQKRDKLKWTSFRDAQLAPYTLSYSVRKNASEVLVSLLEQISFELVEFGFVTKFAKRYLPIDDSQKPEEISPISFHQLHNCFKDLVALYIISIAVFTFEISHRRVLSRIC